MADTPLYPLKLQPIYKPKIWGARRLELLGRSLPGEPGALIGESWELADLSNSSLEGGGGGSERSVVSNGALAGRTLHEVMQKYGPRLMGRLAPTPGGDFPLLVKYLDAGQNLSLQVHPSADYCRQHADAHLKSEAWYVVHADPGGSIYKGIKEGVTPAQFRAAVLSERREEIEALLIKTPVKVGDCHYVPSGTCHALGAGVMVAEVQTPSDTTYRVYDWGRPRNAGRETHLERAMQCIKFGPPDIRVHERRTHIAGMFTAISRLVLCEHFRIEKVRMSEGYEQEIPYDQPAVWIVLQGAGRITPGNGAEAVDFQRGQTLLIPAQMDDARVSLSQDTVWLEVTFPQALAEQIA